MFGVDKCDLCSGKDFIYKRETGEVICKTCGYVAKTINIDMGPEWRQYKSDGVDKSRTGPPQSPLRVNMGLGTVFANYPGKNKRWAERASNFAMSPKERNMVKAIPIFWSVGNKLNLTTNILERAAEIYRMALRRNLVRGRSIEVVVVASIYIALRELGVPRSIREVAKEVGVNKKDLGKIYRLLIRELDIDIPVINPSLFVGRIVSRLGLPRDVAALAEKILRFARDRGATSGRNPVGLASAAVYYASKMKGYKIKQVDVAISAGVTEITVRNVCRHLAMELRFNGIDELDEMLTIHEEGLSRL